ncbi:MAG TPA: MarR family transcriptional regulator [Solirubrobacteraceae bacterium]|nr:MarR family transcriptional regulator [Solirubrobacteraceae bacterium]
MTHAHEVNALGALALEVTRRVQEAGEDASPHGASVPAALTALHGLTGGQSIDALRRVVGLTHSGAVRLVDRLAAAGLVERRVGADGRAVALQLTPEGRRAARRVLARREAAIETVVAPLTARERAELARLHERLLASLTDAGQDRRRVCRLCDVEACGRDCPASVELKPSVFS